MSSKPDYIGVELAAKKLGIGKGHLQTTLKKCGDYPGVYKVPGSSVVLVDKRHLDDIKKLFPKLNKPPKPPETKLPHEPMSMDLMKEVMQEVMQDGVESLKALMLEMRSTVREGVKVSVDDSNFGIELQNAVNQMNNRVTDNNHTTDRMLKIMVRLETKLHTFIDQFIEVHCDEGQSKKIKEVLTAKEQQNASHKLMKKFNSNHTSY